MTLARVPRSTTVLARLLDAPDLVERLRALPGSSFAALVRHVGIEDAGEIVALATTPQIVAAFDEDLFTNAEPGERETFDAERFAAWLEVLVEAGEQAAAKRFAELSEDFVAHALSSLLIVLDHDELMARMDEGGDDAERADKALESALTEEIDGYILASRGGDGWDAALALILALDRDHRAFLVRVLDRCVLASREYVDDLDALADVLNDAASLAEDVEAEREERRARLGYVEARAAKSFLALARQPMTSDARDPITRAYFRELDPSPRAVAKVDRAAAGALPALPGVEELAPSEPAPPEPDSLREAMARLSERDPAAFGRRMQELAYLANVLVAAGTTARGERLDPAGAAEAALLTVELGAHLAAGEGGDLTAVLARTEADLLFRRAMSAPTNSAGLIRTRDELRDVRARSLAAPRGILRA